MKKLWFKRKLFGWGWYPASWEGWVVTLLFILGMMAAVTVGVEENNTLPPLRFVIMALLLVLFISISYRTGETPRWQWGKQKDE